MRTSEQAGYNFTADADMAELADAQDLGSCGEIRVGSTPTIRTSPGQSMLAPDFSFPQAACAG